MEATLNHGSPAPSSPAPTPKANIGNGHKLASAEAALLAYALMHGRLTAAQACWLAGSNTTYLSYVHRMSEEQREELARGEITLAEVHAKRANGNGAETLAQHLGRASAAELEEAARVFGIEHVWDRMIAPVLATEKTKAPGAIQQAEQAAANGKPTV